MNIYVTKDDEKKIENFTNINITKPDTQDELKNIVSNSCENIIIDDIIDYLPHSNIETFIKLLSSKLRINGSLIITGIEIGTLCRSTISEVISPSDFSTVIQARSSMSSIGDVLNILKKNNLKIQSSLVKGLKYEVSATR